MRRGTTAKGQFAPIPTTLYLPSLFVVKAPVSTSVTPPFLTIEMSVATSPSARPARMVTTGINCVQQQFATKGCVNPQGVGPASSARMTLRVKVARAGKKTLSKQATPFAAQAILLFSFHEVIFRGATKI